MSSTQGQAARAYAGSGRAPLTTAIAAVRRQAPAAAGYALPFSIVFYLALAGGGYDEVVRGEVGVAVWWLVLLGCAVGVLPATRVTRLGWVALALLAALGAWTALGIAWSDSSERSVGEAIRVATLLGVLGLATLAQGRDGLRRTVSAVGAAIALVAGLALLSRLQPQWFPANEVAEALPAGYRLNYPLGYWNGLAALIAIGLPLVFWIATGARSTVSRALAAGAIPAMVVAGYYTFSRGGAAAAAVALVALVALHPQRLALLPVALVSAAGGAILIAGAGQRPELADGMTTPLALAQGDEMLALALVTCAGVAMVAAAIALAVRHEIGPRVRVPRRIALAGLAASLAAAVALAASADLPGFASERWEEFKGAGAGPGQGAERFDSSAGNSRYQYWQAAADANATSPLTGIGPGTYEFWWAREGTVPGFVRDAHSLYLETLGELGLVGLALVVALLGLAIGAGASRALGRGDAERRSALAAASAAALAFAFAAALDWAWELTVLPAAFLLLAAAVLGPSAESRWRRSSRFERRPLPVAGRVAVAVAAAGAIVAIAIPLASTTLVRDSQAAVGAGDLDSALADARAAVGAQPYAATPLLQEALVLELRGELGAALLAARAATDAEPVNWRTWFVRSRVAARSGNAGEAVRSYGEAQALNPRSRLLR